MNNNKSRIAVALDKVEQTRNSFLASKSPRYSDDYYRLLSAWENAHKHMVNEGRTQMREVMADM